MDMVKNITELTSVLGVSGNERAAADVLERFRITSYNVCYTKLLRFVMSNSAAKRLP